MISQLTDLRYFDSSETPFQILSIIEQLSSNFIMVNVMTTRSRREHVPAGWGLHPPDLFFNPDGELMDVINEDGNPKYKYYYAMMPRLPIR